MRLQEGRLIKSSADALNLLQNGKLAGMLGGKRFIPSWVLEDGGTELFNTLVEETLNVLGTDPNIAGDQVICFLMKASKGGSEKWEKVITENPDTLIALSKAFAAQWFKAPEWQERVQILIDDPAYDTNLWHDLEKDILETLDKRAAKKGKKITNTANLYETLYDDGKWKLFTPTCFEGDVELASHIKPFKSSGDTYTKTEWCTAANKVYYDNYTDQGTHKLYVIQKWVKGVYSEAWQLSFMQKRIEFMNKTDHPSYAAVRNAPEELLKKIVCDNKENLYYKAINLYDIFTNFDKVNDIYQDFAKNSFIKNKLPIEGDFYVRNVDGESILLGWADTRDTNSTELIVPKGVKKLAIGGSKGMIGGVDGYWFNDVTHKRNVETIVVPEGVEVLKAWCFFEFPKLKNITLPSTLKKIKENAFARCKELEEIVIPEGVVEIESSAFYDCEKLKKITLPSTLKEIPEGLVCYCDSLETIDYPGEVDWVKKLKFADTTPFIKSFKKSDGVILANEYSSAEFETFEIPANTTVIEKFAFSGCKNLREIVIPASVKRIEGNTFWNCESLQSIIFEPGCKVQTIPVDFADNCSNLREVILPEGLLRIEKRAFASTSLESIEIPASVKTLDEECFNKCGNLQTVIIPTNSQLITIGTSAFYACQNLREITLPKKLAKIGRYAFTYSALEEITIPRRVSVIDDSCFYECKDLKRVTITDNITKIEDKAFASCPSFEKLKVLVQPDLLDDFDPYTDIEYAYRSFQDNPYVKVLQKHDVEVYE